MQNVIDINDFCCGKEDFNSAVRPPILSLRKIEANVYRNEISNTCIFCLHYVLYFCLRHLANF